MQLCPSLLASLALCGCGTERTHQAEDPLGLDSAAEWKQRVDACAGLDLTVPDEFEWDPQDIEGALSRIREVSGLRIRTTPQARRQIAIATAGSREYTGSVGSGAPIMWIISAVVGEFGGEWGCEGDGVLIGAQGEIDGWLSLRYFEARDLVGWRHWFHPDHVSNADHETGEEASPTLIAPEVLTRTITYLIDPEVWVSPTRASIETTNGIVMVRGPESTLKRVGAFVEALRASSKEKPVEASARER